MECVSPDDFNAGLNEVGNQITVKLVSINRSTIQMLLNSLLNNYPFLVRVKLLLGSGRIFV